MCGSGAFCSKGERMTNVKCSTEDGKNKGWSERKALNENTPAHEKL